MRGVGIQTRREFTELARRFPTVGTESTLSSSWPAGTKKRQRHDIQKRRTPSGSRTDRKSGMPVRAHEASEYLRTPEDVAAYLNAAIEESDGDPRLLMKAFRNVAAAQGGVSAIARRAEVDRVALSRGLSGNRDPRLGTVTKIAAACGVSLRFVPREATK